jgi:hypothetical protein
MATRFLFSFLLAFSVGCGLDGPAPSNKEEATANKTAAPSSGQPASATSSQAARQRPAPNTATPSDAESAGRQAPPASGAPQKALPDWKGDPQVVDQLAPYDDIEGYEIQPPKSFERNSPQNAPGGAKVVGWAGTPQPDGARAGVTVMVVTIPPESGVVTAEELMEKSIAGLKRRYADFQIGPVEVGLLNGMEFSRADFEGTSREFSMHKHGSLYSSKQGGTWIQLQSLDGADYETTSKLREASVLSFRAKSRT